MTGKTEQAYIQPGPSDWVFHYSSCHDIYYWLHSHMGMGFFEMDLVSIKA